MSGILYMNFLLSIATLSPVATTMLPFFIVLLLLKGLVDVITSKPKRKAKKRPTRVKRYNCRQSISDFTFTGPLEFERTPDLPKTLNYKNLQSLEWKRFEILSREFFLSLGFRADLTKIGADGGIDVVLYEGDNKHPAAIAQCKAWNSRPVGVKQIRELFGVMASEKVSSGIFIITGNFTSEARTFAVGKSLELIDGPTLIDFITQLSAGDQTKIINRVFRGDYITPTCPSCDVKMVKRTAKNNADYKFYGCLNFPRCRQTFPYRKTNN